MERRLWRKVYRLIQKLHRQTAQQERTSGVIYGDIQILAMLMWAVVHERPQQWVCEPLNWPWMPRAWPGLPSASQFSRRLRSPQIQALLNRLEQAIRERWPEEWCVVVDGKPLPVGGFTKDPEATIGYGAGAFYRGYKLHAVWGIGPIPWAWDVLSANVSEPTTASEIVASVPGEGYLLGDAAYDSNPLYRAAARVGRMLIAPRKKPHTGLGKGTRHHPHRLRSIELTEHPILHPFANALHNWRTWIERQFGWLTGGVGGLQNLPTCVRRRSRVKRWVQAKLILHALAT